MFGLFVVCMELYCVVHLKVFWVFGQTGIHKVVSLVQKG